MTDSLTFNQDALGNFKEKLLEQHNIEFDETYWHF